jgi:cysteine synthase
MKVIDYFEQVTDKDGAVMARRLAKEEALFCGYSAGSCITGLMQLKDKLKRVIWLWLYCTIMAADTWQKFITINGWQNGVFLM